jgi:hypothetical protein
MFAGVVQAAAEWQDSRASVWIDSKAELCSTLRPEISTVIRALWRCPLSKAMAKTRTLVKLLLFCDNNERRGVDDRLSVEQNSTVHARGNHHSNSKGTS